jgi:hypothetical protein
MSPPVTVVLVVDVPVVDVLLVVSVVLVVDDVVAVVLVVDVVGTVLVVVVGGSQGHWSGTGTPTEAVKHTSASVAEVGSVPLGAQMQAGSQL